MLDDLAKFRAEIARLGSKIEAKIQEFNQQGVLHGPAREEAAALQILHARVSRSADEANPSAGRLIADELAADGEILKHSFERWIARIDKSSERH